MTRLAQFEGAHQQLTSMIMIYKIFDHVSFRISTNELAYSASAACAVLVCLCFC